MDETKDEHYLRAVTELGDMRMITASQDIYSRNGIKLVASGVHITSTLYDRLVNHVLLKPLDMSLTSEAAVSATTIWSDASSLIPGNDRLKRMVEIIDQGINLQDVIATIKLPDPLAFKLMVARERFPEIYQHSLAIMIMSVYLACCDKMNMRGLGYIAIASLFHDIGILHIDPALFVPNHKMTPEERRHLYTHPLTAYMLLREFPDFPLTISEAVLEHHETLDGRGYPRGLSGKKISRYGQILAVAEVSARALRPDSTAEQWREIETLLKLNFRQYGSGLIGYLGKLRGEADTPASLKEPVKLDEQVMTIARLFSDFEQYENADKRSDIFDFARARLEDLRLVLLEAGFNPHNPQELLQRFSDDPECKPDYGPLLKEIFWQLNALVLDISRHWPDKARTDRESGWLDMIEQVLPVA
jgi:HD-GYP domain-containing protein (c-di-GMP phosphodiesterase class II)